MNGTHSAAEGVDAGESDAQILRALELIYDPRSSNVLRQDASQYLEQMRSQAEAPYRGYLLATDKSKPQIVRHYGLSLLEHAVHYRWSEYSEEQSRAVREWTLKLAQSVTDQDPLFIRNKIAQVWVDIAKRSWALDWMDMDELLVRLWAGSLVQKELVLVILETLSDNSFGREDITTGLRGNDLNKACVEIFTPATILAEHFPTREVGVGVRHGQEGWISRISDLLSWCNSVGHTAKGLETCVIEALSVLRSVAGWAILGALTYTRCVQNICDSLLANNERIQLAAVEALYAIYNRPHFSDDDIRRLVLPMYDRSTVDVLKRLYASSIVEANNIEQEKYLLSKKFSELVHNIGGFMEEKPTLFLEHVDLAHFLDLLLEILQHPSLHVSIPIVHLWAKLLECNAVGTSRSVMHLIGPLLDICSQRLLRYEALPEDSNVPSIIFLNEDVDTTPERHAFLGNYARFCDQVVRSIVAKQPFDALHHILGQVDQVLSRLYEGEPTFEARLYTKFSVPSLKVDAQLSVVEAALKGYARWASTLEPLDTNPQRQAINADLQAWCLRLMDLNFEDPSIKQRVVQTAVEFATGPLKRNAQFTFGVFQFVIDTRAVRQPDAPLYSEAAKDLQSFCVHHLQRLAMRFADDLVAIYDHIEAKVQQFCYETEADAIDRIRCSSVLFIIAQRASSLDNNRREQIMQTFVQPTIQEWGDDRLASSLSSFPAFCDLLGLSGLEQYFLNRNLHLVTDWAEYPLDEEGRALQARIKKSLENLPLHATKILMNVSTERIRLGSQAYKATCTLWSKVLPTMLPNLLQFISHAHAFHNPENWTHFPPDMRGIISRVLTDRFWQVGISSGSRDDFYARVGGSKVSMEGLASTIRGALRTVRESGYRILFCSGNITTDFYRYDELPQPLSKALFAESCALSTHQTSMLIDIIGPMIADCPPEYRSNFLPPLLSAMFTQLDRKVSTEWESIEERNRTATPDDSLTEEMRDESILRQLTSSCVMMVVGLLDPNRNNPPEQAANPTTENAISPGTSSNGGSLRTFILNTPDILKPLILFCTHAIRMHDTRSCGLITRVLRSLIPEFNGAAPIDADVREFISTEVFKACITSIHDPYFVDTQNDLAGLISIIMLQYHTKTDTPRQILQSLPEMTNEKVDHAMNRLVKAQNSSRQQRAIVLKLLEGLRGISISQQGRIAKNASIKTRSAMQEQYMTVNANPNPRKELTPDLGGVADMFG